MFIEDNDGIEMLKLFIEKWAGPRFDQYGLSEYEVSSKIPKPLRELYLFAGNWPSPKNDDNYMPGKQPQLFQQQDVLYGASDLKFEGNRITFLSENQDGYSCQVEEGNDHSPVYSDAPAQWDDTVSNHVIVCNSLPHFLKTFCLRELVMGSKYLYTLDDCTNFLLQDLFQFPIVPLWLDGHYVFGDEEPEYTFYTCEGKILIMDGVLGVWCAFQDENARNLITDMALWRKIQ